MDVPELLSLAVTSFIVSPGGKGCTTVSAVAELLLVLVSGVAEVTLAVFDSVPAGPFAVATNVIVRVAPLAREVNGTLRLFPVPPQIPPPVEAQDTKVAPGGRLSVTTID